MATGIVSAALLDAGWQLASRVLLWTAVVALAVLVVGLLGRLVVHTVDAVADFRDPLRGFDYLTMVAAINVVGVGFHAQAPLVTWILAGSSVRLLCDAAVALWGVGIMLYFTLTTLVMLRLLTGGENLGGIVPTNWIFMGATAITVLVGSMILHLPGHIPVVAMAGPTVGNLATWVAAAAWLLVSMGMAAAFIRWRRRGAAAA